ncbi:MAG: DUF4442 domain-containing protein [Anaerolineales bacterium]|jgi:hypothetical protein
MSESLQTRFERWGFNFFPCYRGTGARISYIAADWREVHVRIPLSLRTRNYVGTIFGGSLYGGVDPIYMLMLIKNLGTDYVVWDKAARIHFKKPGRTTLFARFEIKEQELQEIRRSLKREKSTDRKFTIDLVDSEGIVHAIVEKIIYIAHKA